MTALNRQGFGLPDKLSNERTDSHTRVWRGTLAARQSEGGMGKSGRT